jgi:hypothetical protein
MRPDDGQGGGNVLNQDLPPQGESPMGGENLPDKSSERRQREARGSLPKTALGRFLEERWRESGKTRKDFAQDISISYADLKARLYSSKLPSTKTLAKLRATFGDQLPSAPGEVAGTVTFTEVTTILGVSETTVGDLKNQGKLTPVVGGRYGVVYSRAEVEALRDERAKLGLPRASDTLTPREKRECAFLGCDRVFKYRPANPSNFCSASCRDKTIIGRAIPKTKFGQFLQSEYRKSEQGLAEFSRRISLKVETLVALVDGRSPTDKTVAKLKAVFGDRLPSVSTANEAFRQRGKQRLTSMYIRGEAPGHSPEARAKRAEALRGREMPAEVRAKISAGWKTSPAALAYAEAQRERNRSTKGRALSILGIRLRRRNPEPSKVVLQQWADDVAPQLQLAADVLLALWRPILIERGLRNPGGRPAKTARCQLIADELLRLPAERRRRVPNDFWPRVARLVSEAEGIANPPLDAMGPKVWKSRHRNHPGCALFTPDGVPLAKQITAASGR